MHILSFQTVLNTSQSFKPVSLTKSIEIINTVIFVTLDIL